jgi:MOSC domain-containing protein YiiM
LIVSGSSHKTFAELAAALSELAGSPRERGVLELIVRRPRSGEREVLGEGELTVDEGLVGDRWARGERRKGDADQITIIAARTLSALTPDRARWPLAGDQLVVDLDLSAEHLPPGTRVAVGPQAVIEITPEPHLGCRKFRERFGLDAMRFVGSPAGRALNLRGVHARVVEPGVIRARDVVRALFE